MTEQKKIMFLCNKKKYCRNTIGCGLNCNHTADISFAKNQKFNEKNFKKDSRIKDLWREVEE